MCCGWVPSGSSSDASWMNTRSECTRFENVPDIFQNVLQRINNFMGLTSEWEMEQIEKALKCSLALDRENIRNKNCNSA